MKNDESKVRDAIGRTAKRIHDSTGIPVERCKQLAIKSAKKLEKQ